MSKQGFGNRQRDSFRVVSFFESGSKCNCANRVRGTIWLMQFFTLRRPRTVLFSIVRRVEALGKFLDTEDGKNLLAGYKRATNIIRIEEKKDARPYVGRARSVVVSPG